MKKLSQALAEVKSIESEILRKISRRDEIISENFSPKGWEIEGKKAAEIKKMQDKFIKDQKKKIEDLSKDIEQLKDQLFNLKTKINKKNIELGLDEKIAKVKWLRIELSKLQERIKPDSFSLSSSNLSYVEELGVMDLIKQLEQRKIKLDSEIQNENIRNEL